MGDYSDADRRAAHYGMPGMDPKWREDVLASARDAAPTPEDRRYETDHTINCADREPHLAHYWATGTQTTHRCGGRKPTAPTPEGVVLGAEDDIWDELWDTDAANCCSCPACNHYAPDYKQHQNEPCVLKVLIERIIAARLAERAAHEGLRAHDCGPGQLCSGWCYSDDDAYRTIAAVSWPGERKENRDEWAITMRHRPDLFEHEAARAQERLTAAIAHGRAALAAGVRGGEPSGGTSAGGT